MRHGKPLLFLVVLLVLGLPPVVSAAPVAEEKKIHYLLNEIASSGLVFIRNGKEYTAKEAAAHLQNKWEHAGSRIHTAEAFITYIASSSSMTGTPYYVRLPDGTQQETAGWLHEVLGRMPPAE